MQSITYKKMGTLNIQSTYPRLSKTIIDKLDAVLAQHFGLTDEEFDFIINYDIKYRMGPGWVIGMVNHNVQDQTGKEG